MPEYLVNKNTGEKGEHEVHKTDCRYLPDEENREPLGYFDNCKDAVKKAREKYSTADGCGKCSPECSYD